MCLLPIMTVYLIRCFFKDYNLIHMPYENTKFKINCVHMHACMHAHEHKDVTKMHAFFCHCKILSLRLLNFIFNHLSSKLVQWPRICNDHLGNVSFDVSSRNVVNNEVTAWKFSFYFAFQYSQFLPSSWYYTCWLQMPLYWASLLCVAKWWQKYFA